MFKKKVKSVIAGVAALTNAVAPVVAETTEQVAEINGFAMEQLAARESAVLTKVANVQGGFAFDQNVITPADDVFSMMGTAVTGICAKPAFALEEEQVEDHYINVSGAMVKSYSVDLEELAKTKEKIKLMACACKGSLTVANAAIRGIALKDVLELAELDEKANTVTVYGADGYGLPLPLDYALHKEAMLVYEVGGKALPGGMGEVQFWVPETVAKYFTRKVVRIEVTAEAETPVVETADVETKINVLNFSDGITWKQGQEICFEGYADDNGSPIAAVEFSMDGGETWTAYATENTTTDRWVYWHFSYIAEQPGTYALSVRARTAEGAVSKLLSTVEFTVE